MGKKQYPPRPKRVAIYMRVATDSQREPIHTGMPAPLREPFKLEPDMLTPLPPSWVRDMENNRRDCLRAGLEAKK